MRVAYLGPAPVPTSGVVHVAHQFLTELGRTDDVHAYIAADDDTVEQIGGMGTVASIASETTAGEWGRWYSRTAPTSFVTGQAARVIAQRRLLRRVLADHQREPFDVIWQFSQTELLGLR